MEFSCVDIIPQSCETIVKDRKMKLALLHLMGFIVCDLIEAIESFYINRKYHCFDPHVGETACQIRTFKLLLLSMDCSKQASFYINRLKVIKAIQQNICKRFAQMSHEKPGPKMHMNIFDFLTKMECFFVVDEVEKFLVMSYCLTKYKLALENGETHIDYNKICYCGALKKKLAKKLSRYYQLSLTHLSCNDVIKWAEHADKPTHFIKILQCMMLHDDDDRTVLPGFYFNEVLIANIKKYAFPILIVSQRISHQDQSICMMLFQYDRQTGDFQPLGEDSIDYLHTPCFAVKGVTVTHQKESCNDFVKRFIEVGIENILQTNMAMHPQYSGNKLSPYRDDPFVKMSTLDSHEKAMRAHFYFMKRKAMDIGCCIENSSLFFVKHVLCDSVKSQIKQIKQKGCNKIDCWGIEQQALEFSTLTEQQLA